MRGPAELWRPPMLDIDSDVPESPRESPADMDVEAERQRLRAQAWETGYAEGRDQGLQDGHTDSAEVAAKLGRLLARLSEPVEALDAELEQSVLALAVEIARRIVLHDISVNPDLLKSIVAECLRRVPLHHGPLRLRVNPTDKEVLEAHPLDLMPGDIEICADPSLSPGGCVLEMASHDPARPDRRWEEAAGSSPGEVDARIERRWRQVMAALFDEDLIQ